MEAGGGNGSVPLLVYCTVRSATYLPDTTRDDMNMDKIESERG